MTAIIILAAAVVLIGALRYTRRVNELEQILRDAENEK